MGLIKKLFGSYSDKEVKKIQPIVNQVLALEDSYASLSDSDLKNKTEEFRNRLNEGETLDDILPEAFATMREAAWRVLKMKHFPVQVIGGIVLHQGRIAEMKTGEGKTLVATLPAYLNALSGKGVHIVTVNEYLSRRDSEWMGKVYSYLGLSVGLVLNGMGHEEKQEAYKADITYATNNELGFDYLRDNMVIYKEDKVQREFNFAIVDEVDSILIDEARTPLIISGQGDKSTELYSVADKFAKKLTFTKVKEVNTKEDTDAEVTEDYIVDEKAKTATLTKHGVKKAEAAFNLKNLMDPENLTLQHHINQAIKANSIMKRDIDYVVKDGQIVIIDEFTGRMMDGRRYSEGLHQAIEAKENVKVERESKTLATITFQNYFRLYKKLSGMTGTALTEENEFREIYSLDVVAIPTNRPVTRIDNNDMIYKNEEAKDRAVVARAKEAHEKGQPVLIGTVSIENSEHLSGLLKRNGLKHNVLNAKNHEKEAEIVAQAGKFGNVTIATNMAGRGTDIVLGGNPEYMAKNQLRKEGMDEELIAQSDGHGFTEDKEILAAREKYEELVTKYKRETDVEAEQVKAAGGLLIVGTERHESRRIDNQLRGRSGRQGDPGESVFFISLEDDLMRLFGGERIQNMMDTLKVEDDMPLEMKMLTNSIENAQKKVEGRNFSIRKSVLGFDDVMNAQRQIIYTQRNTVLNGDNMKEAISTMITSSVENAVGRYIGEEIEREEWNLVGLKDYYLGLLTKAEDFHYSAQELEKITVKEIQDELTGRALALYDKKEAEFGEDMMRQVERVILLKQVDTKWMAHIDAMEELKRGIYLRSYAQRDPIVEYRIEGFDMFDEMVASIQEDTARSILTVQIENPDNVKREQVATPTQASLENFNPQQGPVPGEQNTNAPEAPKQQPIRVEKVGRNDPCPCGSGLKYKKCHGK